jgi:hypothetical protein
LIGVAMVLVWTMRISRFYNLDSTVTCQMDEYGHSAIMRDRRRTPEEYCSGSRRDSRFTNSEPAIVEYVCWGCGQHAITSRRFRVPC